LQLPFNPLVETVVVSREIAERISGRTAHHRDQQQHGNSNGSRGE
jgi:hypothetical protein